MPPLNKYKFKHAKIEGLTVTIHSYTDIRAVQILSETVKNTRDFNLIFK